MLDPTFSEHSYGFRPGRRAHDAVLAAQAYVQSGRRVVVDVDLEKFFDRVNHDILMDRLAKRIGDAASAAADPGVSERRDHERWGGGGAVPGDAARRAAVAVAGQRAARRGGPGTGAAGSCFARYADDCNVYVRSATGGRAGDGAAAAAVREAAAHGQRDQERGGAACSGASSWGTAYGWPRAARSSAAWPTKPMATFKQRVRQLTRRSGGRSMAEVAERLRPYLLGWKAYFRLAQTPRGLARAGRVVAPSTAGDPAQALEARDDDVPRTESAGRVRR